MGAKRMTMAALAGALCAAGGAAGRELTWVGASGAKWDTTTTGSWVTRDANEPAVFANGDSVYFSTQTGDATVKLEANLSVGNLVVDAASKFTFGLARNNMTEETQVLKELESFQKTGAGTLVFPTDFVKNAFTNDVELTGGELQLTGWNGIRQLRGDMTDPALSGLGNPQIAHTLHVGPDAVFYVDLPWPFGGPQSTPKIKIVMDGKVANKWLSSGWGNAPIAFGELHLNSSQWDVHGQDYTTNWRGVGTGGANINVPARYWPSFAWNGDVYFNMPEAFTLAGRGDICVGAGRVWSALHVPDITGDDGVDVRIEKNISDALPVEPTFTQDAAGKPVFASFARPSTPSRFIKDGAGTLLLTSGSSSFTGDVFVRGGTLRLSGGRSGMAEGRGGLGNPQAARTIAVGPGATLDVQADYVFGSKHADNRTTFAVTNGTIRIGSFTPSNNSDVKTEIAYLVNFGSLDLYDATLELPDAGHSNGRIQWGGTDGLFALTRRASFDGTRPYVIAGVSKYNVITLGCGLDAAAPVTNIFPKSAANPDVLATNVFFSGRTEFCVRDITGGARGDSAPDVTIEPALQNIPDQYATDKDVQAADKAVNQRFFSCGLLKTGAGTLRLTAANTYTGATEVAEGVLRVDGSLAGSDVTVGAGGFIAGTGAVKSLAVGAGGCVVVDFADPSARLTVAGGFTLPAAGVIRVANYTGAIERFRLPNAFSLAGAANKDAVDAAQWRVVVDGQTAAENNKIVVTREGDFLSLAYQYKGLTLVIR